MIELKLSDKRARVKKVKSLMLSAGNLLGSVWFRKRSNQKIRRMVYRLNVTEPTYNRAPKGESKVDLKANDLLCVFDCNSIKYSKKELMNGRGSYKSVPLDGVFRLKVNGQIYRIRS